MKELSFYLDSNYHPLQGAKEGFPQNVIEKRMLEAFTKLEKNS